MLLHVMKCPLFPYIIFHTLLIKIFLDKQCLNIIIIIIHGSILGQICLVYT